MEELPANLQGKPQAESLTKLPEVGAIEIRNIEVRHDTLDWPLGEIKKDELKQKRLIEEMELEVENTVAKIWANRYP